MAYEGHYLPVPVGTHGMVFRSNRLLAQPGELYDADNVQLDDSVCEKAEGATNLDSTGIATCRIVNLFDWHCELSGTEYQYLISAGSDGKIYRSDTHPFTNLDATTLVTGLNGNMGQFVAGGIEAAGSLEHLFFFNGKNQVQVLDGTTTTMNALATPPADWGGTAADSPVGGTIHNFRLCGYGNLNDPHRLYFSDPDNHENFTAADTISLAVYSNIGKRIWAARSFNGILFIWKNPVGIFFLDDSDILKENWVVRPKSESIGCAPSPNAVLTMTDDIIFMAADGSFHLLSAVQTMGGTQASDLTKSLGLTKWIRANVNLARINQVNSTWHETSKTAIFTVPATGDTWNSLTLKFDFSDVSEGQPVKFSYSTRDVADAVCTAKDGSNETYNVLASEGVAATAKVWEQNNSSRTKGGAYTMTMRTAAFDCGTVNPEFRAIRKNFDHIEAIFDPAAAGTTLTCAIYVDGSLKDTVTFDATKRRQIKYPSIGSGYEIHYIFTNAQDDKNPRLLGFIQAFTASSKDQSR